MMLCTKFLKIILYSFGDLLRTISVWMDEMIERRKYTSSTLISLTFFERWGIKNNGPIHGSAFNSMSVNKKGRHLMGHHMHVNTCTTDGRGQH